MLDESADVPASQVGEPAVAVLVVEQRLAVLPQRLVAVHARAVVAEERLRHEGRGLALLPRGVLDDVLEQLDVVGRVEQRVEAVVDLGLAAGADLVVRALEDEPGLDQPQRDVVAEVGLLVDGGDGEVAALLARRVAEVAALDLAAGVPVRLLRVDLVEGAARRRLVAHRVEDVELGLRREECGVGDAGRGEVLLRLLRDLAGILRVDLARARVEDVAHDDERALGAELVEVRGRHVGDELHVGLGDASEAADRRAVEHLPDLEEVLICRRSWDVEVLLHPRHVGESDVDELDVRLLDELDDFLGGGEHAAPWC